MISSVNDAGSRPRTVADKVMSIVRALSESAGPVKLSDLAAATSLPKATCHRVVHDLVEQGYAAVTGRGEYGAGPGLRALSASVRAHDVAAETIEQSLLALARATGHVSAYAARVGREIRVLALANPAQLPVPVRIGAMLAAGGAVGAPSPSPGGRVPLTSEVVEGAPTAGFWTFLTPVDPDGEEFLTVTGFALTPPDVGELSALIAPHAAHLGHVEQAGARAV